MKFPSSDAICPLPQAEKKLIGLELASHENNVRQQRDEMTLRLII
jgi:hypothetical protein